MTLILGDVVNQITSQPSIHGRSTAVMWLLASVGLIIVTYLLIDVLTENYRDRRFRQRMHLRSVKPRGRKQIKVHWKSFLPDVPRPTSIRSKAADWVFIIFQLLSWGAPVAGAVIGGSYYGGVGGGYGLVVGGVIGFWTRRSLGLRGHDRTQGYFVRMAERANGDRPKLLESLVETVRGERLSKIRCRRIADARAETLRHWQSCDLSKERARLPGGANPEIPGTAQEPKKVSS